MGTALANQTMDTPDEGGSVATFHHFARLPLRAQGLVLRWCNVLQLHRLRRASRGCSEHAKTALASLPRITVVRDAACVEVLDWLTLTWSVCSNLPEPQTEACIIVGRWAWLGREQGWLKLPIPVAPDGLKSYGHLVGLNNPHCILSLLGQSVFEYTGNILTDVISTRQFIISDGTWDDVTWDASQSQVPRWRIGCATATLGSRIVVAGGYEDDEPGPKRYECIPKSSVFVFDPLSGECEWLDDLPLSPNDTKRASKTPMRTHCASCLTPDGRHFVVSGGTAMERHVQFDDEDEDDDDTWSPRSSCVAYSFVSSCWINMPPMTVPRSFHKLLAAGGHIVALGGHSDLAELFDHASGRWLKLPLKEIPQGVVACL
jgi:hypothetical protein